MSKVKCKDHLGNEYDSKSDMLKAYNINKTTFNRRIKRGYSLEEILTDSIITNRKRRNIKCKDHLGNEYESKVEMCKAYAINPTTFNSRIKQGYSLEESLTTSKINNTTNGIKCKDHLGNEYDSKSKMCEVYGITESKFNSRIKRGYSLEESLTSKKIVNRKRKSECKDHLGNTYYSKGEMCKAYNIDHNIFNRRIRDGWSLEDALTIEYGFDHCKNGIKCKDHLGNEYDSINKMCKAYDINKTTFNGRIKNGCSLEDALTMNSNTYIKCKDHLGNEYDSINKMCKAYSISITTFTRRMKNEWSLKNALIIPINIDYNIIGKIIDDNLSVISRIGDNYYDCIFYGKNDVFSLKEILDYIDINIEDTNHISLKSIS